MSLPIDRLRDAGAHETEIAQLETEHDALSPEQQKGRIRFFAEKATADIREWLKAIRSDGYFKGPEPTETPVDASEGTVTAEQKDDKPADGDKPATRAKK